MKQYLLALVGLLLISEKTLAQFYEPIEDPNQKQAIDSFYKWTLEPEIGMSKSYRPFDPGYYSGHSSKFFNGVQVNHIGFSIRHMVNDKFGYKARLSYDYIHDLYNSDSRVFELNYLQLGFEGVANLFSLCEVNEYVGRWGLLAHGGIHASVLQPMYGNNSFNIGANIGLSYGITPEFRISDRSSIYLDWANSINYFQPYTWNGSNNSDDKTGTMRTVALGLAINIGYGIKHVDWYFVPRKKESKEVSDIENRLATIEMKMKDTDKDGVADYLDEEPNSLLGSYVDTKGRMLDKNNDGVPDYIDVYIDNSTKENSTGNASEDVILQMLNNGFIAAYFYFNSTQPSNNSTPNIGFLYRYMKVHQNAKVVLTGYADVIGSENANRKLSQQRADAVKAMLVKAGIQSARISTIGGSVDNSVDRNNSELARRLMRRVVFQIK